MRKPITHSLRFLTAALRSGTARLPGYRRNAIRQQRATYGNPLNRNTDGDTCTDGKEASSVNADWKVNSLDMLAVAQAFGPKGSAKYIPDFDVNRDGTINSLDMLIQAKVFGIC